MTSWSSLSPEHQCKAFGVFNSIIMDFAGEILFTIKCVFGLNKEENALYHIDQAISLKMVNLVCPSCYKKLTAVNGVVRAKHFRHDASDHTNHCSETSLHIRAKNIISKQNFISIPLSSAYSILSVENGILKRDRIPFIDPAGKVVSSSMELRKAEYGVVPDCTMDVDFGNGVPAEVNFEISVTHAIDDKKLDKISKSTSIFVEIDLSSVDRDLSDEELLEILLDHTKYSVKHNKAAPSSMTEKIPKGWHLFHTKEADLQYEKFLGSLCTDIDSKAPGRNFTATAYKFDFGREDFKSDDLLSSEEGIPVITVNPDYIVSSSKSGASKLARYPEPYPCYVSICEFHFRELESQARYKVAAMWFKSALEEFKMMDNYLSSIIPIDRHQGVSAPLVKDLFGSRYVDATLFVRGYAFFGSILTAMLKIMTQGSMTPDAICDRCFADLNIPLKIVYDGYSRRLSYIDNNIWKNSLKRAGVEYDVSKINTGSLADKFPSLLDMSAFLKSVLETMSMDKIEFLIKSCLKNLQATGLVSRSACGNLFSLGGTSIQDCLKSYYRVKYYKKLNIMLGLDHLTEDYTEVFCCASRDFSFITSIPGNGWCYGYRKTLNNLSDKFNLT